MNDTFFGKKHFRLSSVICGNCRRGFLNSQKPCTIIAHNFIQFSTVFIVGKRGTTEKRKHSSDYQCLNMYCYYKIFSFVCI